MNAVDGTGHFEKPTHELSPSLLTIILDTNPAAWTLLSPTLTLSATVANLLVFINAHLAANYTNRVAVIASHCDKAQWLYPTATEQRLPRSSQDRQKRQPAHGLAGEPQDLTDSTKRLKLTGPSQPSKPSNSLFSSTSTSTSTSSSRHSNSSGSKYRPFRLVEEELVRNLTLLLSNTTPEAVASSTSTMIAGALTLALSHINRESITYAESLIGSGGGGNSTANDGTGSGHQLTSSTNEARNTSLQSRILLISASPSTDLAHQYIPIMNAIFACQRLSIPIDILSLPLPQNSPSSSSSSSSSPADPSSNSTVFLQQAADATKGIFIPVQLPSKQPASTSSPASSSTASTASQALLTYLLTSFLPSPTTRSAHLILPTRIDVDFRAACFCHRNVVSTGFVCSICLSIFCAVPDNGDCLTCGTHLSLGNYGARPVVVPRRKVKAKAK